VGIFEICDLSGVDLILAISEYLYKELDCSKGPSSILKEKVSKGQLGVKSGKGFYDWTKEKAASVIKKRDEHLIRILKEGL
jgi:3-hydroxybutyryl-CoA dehydrogenase